MPIEWRAWYDGGRVFDSSAVEWEDLPDDGVQLVVVTLPDGTRSMSGCDFYFKAGDVIGANNDGDPSITERYPGASVKRGRWTSDEEIARIKQAANS